MKNSYKNTTLMTQPRLSTGHNPAQRAKSVVSTTALCSMCTPAGGHYYLDYPSAGLAWMQFLSCLLTLHGLPHTPDSSSWGSLPGVNTTPSSTTWTTGCQRCPTTRRRQAVSVATETHSKTKAGASGRQRRSRSAVFGWRDST